MVAPEVTLMSYLNKRPPKAETKSYKQVDNAHQAQKLTETIKQ